MVVRKLQIHSGFLHTDLCRQAQSCLHGTGPEDFVLKNKVYKKVPISGSTLIFKNTLNIGLKNILVQTSRREISISTIDR